MSKYIIGYLVLVFSGFLFAESEETLLPDNDWKPYEVGFYDYCEQLDVVNYPKNLMRLDLLFNRVYLYAVSRDRDQSNFEEKIACLKQKREDIYKYTLTLLKDDVKKNKPLQGDYLEYLVKKKDSYTKKILLHNFRSSELNSLDKEKIINYLLFYQTFYINDNDGYTNLREQHTKSSKIIKSLNNGTKITLLNYEDNWWYVALDNEQKGYIYADRISDSPREL